MLNEPDLFETSLTLIVERTGGLLGNISAQWSISGDHSVGEITPANGTVRKNRKRERERVNLINGFHLHVLLIVKVAHYYYHYYYYYYYYYY